MHIPAVDRPIDDEEWRSFVRAQGFGHLVAPGVGRPLPVISALQYVYEDDCALLHVAAANPIVDALAERSGAVLSVAGDRAFIPSAWKAIGDEDPRLGLPTTYYAAVQLAGHVELVGGTELAALLRRQLDALQPDVPIEDPQVAHPARLAAITGIRLVVEVVRAKFKFGGNVDAPHRRAVIERLIDRDGPRDAVAAAHARRRTNLT